MQTITNAELRQVEGGIWPAVYALILMYLAYEALK